MLRNEVRQRQQRRDEQFGDRPGRPELEHLGSRAPDLAQHADCLAAKRQKTCLSRVEKAQLGVHGVKLGVAPQRRQQRFNHSFDMKEIAAAD